MRKVIQLIIPLLIYLQIGCQERGQPGILSYSFFIVDSAGNNIVGDSIHPNRYHIDSIRFNYIFSNGQIDTSNHIVYMKDYYKGYVFFAGFTTKSREIHYLLKYNSTDQDTFNAVWNKDNVYVYKNNKLIYSKLNLSLTDQLVFNIIK